MTTIKTALVDTAPRSSPRPQTVRRMSYHKALNYGRGRFATGFVV